MMAALAGMNFFPHYKVSLIESEQMIGMERERERKTKLNQKL